MLLLLLLLLLSTGLILVLNEVKGEVGWRLRANLRTEAKAPEVADGKPTSGTRVGTGTTARGMSQARSAEARLGSQPPLLPDAALLRVVMI